jgi:hypothetical protein
MARHGITRPLLMLGLPDYFIEHGDVPKLLAEWALGGCDEAIVVAGVQGALCGVDVERFVEQSLNNFRSKKCALLSCSRFCQSLGVQAKQSIFVPQTLLAIGIILL